MVDAKGLDLNDNITGLWLGFRDVLVDEAVEAAEFLENDGTHAIFSIRLGSFGRFR
jgi:hypothetical protein